MVSYGKQRKFLASITFSGRIVQDDRLYFVCMFAQTMAAIAQTWGFTLSNSRPKKKRAYRLWKLHATGMTGVECVARKKFLDVSIGSALNDPAVRGYL
jgi:hypothetical protein